MPYGAPQRPAGDAIIQLASSARANPALVDRPPAGPGWLHEIKHDGFRVIASKQGERA
jgi:ATP-dependent DNA ligase